MKNYYKGMTDEQIVEKKRQFNEMGEAYKSLSIQDRAAMIIHFMQMKLQWDTMSDDEKTQKKTEMKQMFQEYLPLTLEEKEAKASAIYPVAKLAYQQKTSHLVNFLNFSISSFDKV